MGHRRRLFAGEQLRQLRKAKGLRQIDFAKLISISTPYLSQLEHNDRPLTASLAERIAQQFPLEWQDFGLDDTEQLTFSLREALSDPAFKDPPAADAITKLAEQQPAFARQFVELHELYRRTTQRLEMVDEAVAVDDTAASQLPWEQVRDWFHLANNYVDELDRSAEALAETLISDGPHVSQQALRDYLLHEHGVRVVLDRSPKLRRFSADQKVLTIDTAQSASGIRFQLAYQLAVMSLGETIQDISQSADLTSSAARALLKVGLANYAAGALLMPYERFRQSARALRHDIDRLAQDYLTSFEQTCHRLSNLQRSGARGLPVFFFRVDMAGNITKRHSATRLQFARFGGACPLWIVHEAAAIPERVLVQLAQTPDGVRYVSMAKGLVKPSGQFDVTPRRYAVALGCEVDHASDFVYADTIDTSEDAVATKIGASCRICPREDCSQRAYPPSDQQIMVDLQQRGIVPYELSK